MKSFYTITFQDGTSAHSDDISWHDYAEKIKVSRRGKPSLVYASRVPIKSITAHHLGLEKTLEIPEGCRVFQATAARTIFSGDQTKNEVAGRTIGIIKDNIVVEEYNINIEAGTITGFKL
jgi:hypothetical protein